MSLLVSSISLLFLPIYFSHSLIASCAASPAEGHKHAQNASVSHVVEDINGVLQLYSNGTIFRAKQINFNIPIRDDASVVWEESVFDKKHNLTFRLYKPASKSAFTKLPIVFFFHGGGFCVGSCTWPNDHNAALRLASGLKSLVVAPDYRLAPEHRLPAAYDDALTSLKWLRAQALSPSPDAWLTARHVDFDRVYVVGDSSGGNIAHHLAVQLRRGSLKLAPVRIRGYVLMSPFFGGTVRTKSEVGPPEAFLNLPLLDSFWRLSLPIGEDQDCSSANPFGPRSKSLEKVKLDPILVTAGSRELLRDRAEDYARRLQHLGKKVFYVEYEREQHGFFLDDPYSEKGTRVIQDIQRFMSNKFVVTARI